MSRPSAQTLDLSGTFAFGAIPVKTLPMTRSKIVLFYPETFFSWFCEHSQKKCVNLSFRICIKASHKCLHSLDNLSPQM